jgi:hypothetical protein
MCADIFTKSFNAVDFGRVVGNIAHVDPALMWGAQLVPVASPAVSNARRVSSEPSSRPHAPSGIESEPSLLSRRHERGVGEPSPSPNVVQGCVGETSPIPSRSHPEVFEPPVAVSEPSSTVDDPPMNTGGRERPGSETSSPGPNLDVSRAETKNRHIIEYCCSENSLMGQRTP